MRPSSSALKLLRLRIKHGSRALAISSCHLMDLCRIVKSTSALLYGCKCVKPSDVASYCGRYDHYPSFDAPTPPDSLWDATQNSCRLITAARQREQEHDIQPVYESLIIQGVVVPSFHVKEVELMGALVRVPTECSVRVK